jgi:hypothetical protein
MGIECDVDKDKGKCLERKTKDCAEKISIWLSAERHLPISSLNDSGQTANIGGNHPTMISADQLSSINKE